MSSRIGVDGQADSVLSNSNHVKWTTSGDRSAGGIRESVSHSAAISTCGESSVRGQKEIDVDARSREFAMAAIIAAASTTGSGC